MEKKILEYKSVFTDKNFLSAFGLSMVLFLMSLIVNFYAGTYATTSASNSVTDIILSNTHAYDLGEFFVYGSLLFATFGTVVCFHSPKKLPFVVKSIALFIIIRSIFISMTHIGPFPSQISIGDNIFSFFNKLTFGGDLFFSGHTGMPFLMALLFWKDKWIRYTFLAFSLIFAIVVLLAHMHYTIDVLSAFFITYSIFEISKYLFKKDRVMFHGFDIDGII